MPEKVTVTLDRENAQAGYDALRALLPKDEPRDDEQRFLAELRAALDQEPQVQPDGEFEDRFGSCDNCERPTLDEDLETIWCRESESGEQVDARICLICRLEAAQQVQPDGGERKAIRELDRIAMAAWRAREALHLNLAELGKGLDAATTKNLADLVNDLNEHMPLAEDGHVWRRRKVVVAALADHQPSEECGCPKIVDSGEAGKYTCDDCGRGWTLGDWSRRHQPSDTPEEP